MIKFRIKKDIELDYLEKYDFKEEKSRFVYWNGLVKMQVMKNTRILTFNMPNNDTLLTFMKMVEDDIVEVLENPLNYRRYHYIGLSEEEYELIQKTRIEKGEL